MLDPTVTGNSRSDCTVGRPHICDVDFLFHHVLRRMDGDLGAGVQKKNRFGDISRYFICRYL